MQVIYCFDYLAIMNKDQTDITFFVLNVIKIRYNINQNSYKVCALLSIGVTSLPNKANGHQDTILWSLLQPSLKVFVGNILTMGFL